MIELLRLILHIVTSLFKPRAKLAAEILVLQRASPAGIEATTTQQCRSLSVGLALSQVPLRPRRDCYPPAGDDHPLASSGVPGLLALAVRQSSRQAQNRSRTAQAHWRDEPCKSPLGCATHSWRTAQARLHARSVDGRAVHVSRPAVPGLAHLSEQSCRR